MRIAKESLVAIKQEAFRKNPELIHLVISSLIYTLLICLLLPVLIFHLHSLFNFSTDSKYKEKGQDS